MIHGLDCKTLLLNSDFTVDNGAFTVTEVDTLGYRYAIIDVCFGNVPANVAACQVTESDTAGSGHANISGASATVTAAAGDGKVYGFALDLRSRKRYLDLTLTAGDGSGTVTEAAVICKLYRGDQAPVGATELGYTGGLVQLP